LVGKVSEWPYSSFHRYVKQGGYLVDWGNNDLEFSFSFVDRLE